MTDPAVGPHTQRTVHELNLERRISAIENRNERVEKDKAWETSWPRKALIALFTYFSVAVYLAAIDINHAWLNAIVPTVGFTLSTLTMPFFKRMWLKRRSH